MYTYINKFFNSMVNSIFNYLQWIDGSHPQLNSWSILYGSRNEVEVTQRILKFANQHVNERAKFFKILYNNTDTVDCTIQGITGSLFYIYSSTNSKNICYLSPNIQHSLSIIANSTHIPFYKKLIGYNDVHFELFSNYPELLQRKIELPIGSTLIRTIPSNHTLMKSHVEEIMLHSLLNHNSNPYIKFIYYLLNNLEENMFIIITPNGLNIFSTDISTLMDFTDQGLASWQYKQITNFVAFVKNYNLNQINYNQEEYMHEVNFFFNKFSQNKNLKDYKQNLSFVRLKELLLFSYLVREDILKIEALINEGVSVNAQLLNGIKPLYWAVEKNKYFMAKFLINAGAEIDAARIDNNTTALIAAVRNNNYNITKLLLDSSANVNLIDANGASALIYAAKLGNNIIAEELINFKAEVNLEDKNGLTPLVYTALKGNEVIMSLMLKALNLKTNLASENLILTVLRNGQLESNKIIRTLLKHYNNNLSNLFEEDSPLCASLINTNKQVLNLVLTNGLHSTLQDKQYYDCIILATDVQKIKIEAYEKNPINYIIKYSENPEHIQYSLDILAKLTFAHNLIDLNFKAEDCLSKINSTIDKNQVLQLCGSSGTEDFLPD